MMMAGMWGKLARGTSGKDKKEKDIFYTVFVFQEGSRNILLS